MTKEICASDDVWVKAVVGHTAQGYADIRVVSGEPNEGSVQSVPLGQLRAHNRDSAEPVAWSLVWNEGYGVNADTTFKHKDRAEEYAMKCGEPKPRVVPLYLASPPAKEVDITEEMVERAARSIYETDDVWSTAMPFDTIPDFDKGTYRTFARAALTAALTNRTPDGDAA